MQVPALDLERYRHSRNRVALSLSPNMAGSFDRVDQVMRVILAFQHLGDDRGTRTFFAFWLVEARLTVVEQREVKQRLKEIDMPEIMEWFKQEGLEEGYERGIERGIERGMRTKALEDARKLVEHGVSWAIITSATGIKPEDLEAKVPGRRLRGPRETQ